MNKKFLIISIIVLAVILFAGFIIYKYMSAPVTEVQNSEVQNNDQTPQIQIEAGGIEIEGNNNGGGLTICSDKCGDNVCEPVNPECESNNNLNCTCLENKQECPQDCK